MLKILKYIFGNLVEEDIANKIIVFSAVARGFYVYKIIWKPKEGEKTDVLHEDGNPYDMFSIKFLKLGEKAQILGHLPIEISRIILFTKRCNCFGKYMW